LHHQSQRDPLDADGLYPEHVQRSEYLARDRWFRDHLGTDLPQQLGGVFDIGPVAEWYVDDREGEVLVVVTDPDDLSVTDVPDSAVQVAQRGDAESHSFDRAGGLSQFGPV